MIQKGYFLSSLKNKSYSLNVASNIAGNTTASQSACIPPGGNLVKSPESTLPDEATESLSSSVADLRRKAQEHLQSLAAENGPLKSEDNSGENKNPCEAND